MLLLHLYLSLDVRIQGPLLHYLRQKSNNYEELCEPICSSTSRSYTLMEMSVNPRKVLD